jgi:VIT1/CCC1 family predicted Fe2+/Mn2+ transporter
MFPSARQAIRYEPIQAHHDTATWQEVSDMVDSRDAGSSAPPPHADEFHSGSLSDRLNWLRAGALGANDGLVSTAGIVVGVAGATSNLTAVFTAGVAGLVAGSLSMASGEYVSVSTQRDTETAAIELETWELENQPGKELDELTAIYQARGISPRLAREVAIELTQNDALHAHAEVELKIDPNVLTSPWQAAGASFLAFAVGGAIPAAAILVPWEDYRVIFCVGAVILGLIITGYLSAKLGKANPRPAAIRNVIIGCLTMLITWLVGRLTGGIAL